MDFFEKYRYQKDNPEEFGIDLKKIERPQVLDESHLSNLLSHSIKVTKDILPTVQKSIDEVFKKLKIENQFNFVEMLLAEHEKSRDDIDALRNILYKCL